MSTPAILYLRETSALMDNRYPGDCVDHAIRIAERLRADGGSPWIGRIRDLVVAGELTISHPLIPVRFSGIGKPQWSTHYICCEDRLAYDPLIGEPVPVDELAMRVFGRALEVVEVVPASDVKALLEEGTLRLHLRRLVKIA